MYKTIYKYPLQIISVQKILLPAGAEILAVQLQNKIPYLWALVDINTTEKENRTIELFGTGHAIWCTIENSRKYISTFQFKKAGLVYHVFEYTGS